MRGITLWGWRIWVKILLLASAAYLPFLPLGSVAVGQTGQIQDETMLMFVGEELSVVTVASRHPESPLAAPAVVSVVNRSDIEQRGFQTLGELLAREPGFYVAQRAEGSVPYLRGIPDGVLFLYDGVPVTSDVTKNFHPLDRELSLNSVKRVEMVRGPSSVLWGPDAFAGVVNVVPLTGRDRPGVEAKAFGGSERLHGGYLGWGLASAESDMYLSAYGAKDRYHDADFTVLRPAGPGEEDVFGKKAIDDSYYLELTGNAHVGDWLSLSGRYSDFKRRYTLNSDDREITWEGERQTPFSFLKANISKVVGRSHLSLTGYYQYAKYDVSEVNKERNQKNHILYGEFLWDYRLLEKGLLTAGVSYRRNKVLDAVAAETVLPPSLKPPVPQFLPAVSEENYTNDLKSLFFQYRHRLKDVDLWAGGRVDAHSQYDTTLSHSLGFNWRILDDWRVKGVYGTAYRSIYSKQLFDGESFNPERISTISLQLAWESSPEKSAGLTAFYSSLKDRVAEDPYGGLSKPTDQDIVGLELSARTRLWKRLDLFGNATVLHNWGDPDEYEAIFYFVRPDGTVVPKVEKWSQAYDEGPNVIANLGMIWQIHPRVSLALEAGMTGKVPYTFTKDTVSGHYDQDLQLDATLRIKDVLLKGSTLTFRGTNMLDQDYQIPDLYGPTDSPPLAFYAEWALRF